MDDIMNSSTISPIGILDMATASTSNSFDLMVEKSKYSTVETIAIVFVAGTLSILTILGNVMVMVSFKLDKQLQTISNYFLLSLAVADFFIGLISMPLYTMYTVMDRWPLGPLVCDTWLALDYLNSNASVLNLLVISFDRYFSVTRPLTYRVRRTTRKACLMIASTWILSLLLWPPWIFAWPYIEGKRTVPETECYIQFLETNLYITFGTALLAFYIPVTVMCVLYWRVWRETEKRYKDLTTLFLVSAVGGQVRSPKGADNHIVNLEKGTSSTKSRSGGDLPRVDLEPEEEHGFCYRFCCWPWVWIKKQLDSAIDQEEDEEDVKNMKDMTSTTEDDDALDDLESTSGGGSSRGLASDSIYTILITLGGAKGHDVPIIATPTTTSSAAITPIEDHHSIKQFFESAIVTSGPDGEDSSSSGPTRPGSGRTKGTTLSRGTSPHRSLTRMSSSSTARSTTTTTMAPTASTATTAIASSVAQPKSEKKAAKTLSAILLAFIITWTPYNVLVLIKTLSGDSIDANSSFGNGSMYLNGTASSTPIPHDSFSDAGDSALISDTLWKFSYYLCYFNSTINPFCYALCNINFRNTYIRILKCQWSLRGSRAKRAAADIHRHHHHKHHHHKKEVPSASTTKQIEGTTSSDKTVDTN